MDGVAEPEGELAPEGPTLRVRRQTSAQWPEKGTLTKAMEEDADIRNSFRMNKSQLLAWCSPKLVGVASLKSLALNVPVIKLAIQIWGSHTSVPKTMPIDWLKQEAHA